MNGRELKARFENEFLDKCCVITVVTVAVLLPNGAIEIITNTQYTSDKIQYYLEKYDDEFRLLTNPMIRIVGYMLV